MKRLIVVLGSLLALPAFAEVAPFFYDDVTEYSDMEYDVDGTLIDGAEIVADEDVAPQQPVPAVKSNPRVTTLRNGSRVGTAAPNINQRRSADANSRVVAARTTTARTTSASPARVATSRGTTSRAADSNAVTGVSTRRVANASNANVARAGAVETTGTMTTSITSTSGSTTIPVVGSRIGMRTTSTAARVPTIRVASATMTTGESSVSNAQTTSEMDQLVELTDYCKAQYTACMDNFCNVLDDNQGRCSCSKNLKNYEKTEDALRAATEELQDVAQKIQYIELTGDEITTLFKETEAEEEMRGKTDNSQIKSSLDKIKSMIVDVKPGTASSVADDTMSFDLSNLLDFTISSTGFDLSALFGNTSSNTSSISNQRGETLYKTASARCKANVLNACAAQGVDASVITNGYDLEIDKQCIAYERSLSDANTEMSSTVRNAKTVLQKARLMVAQQKNQYDLRGCVSALDNCMQDDYVCGADYENCLDPSGKYIVNGQIVSGSLPGKPLTDAANESGMFKEGLYKTWLNGSTYAWDYDDNNSGDLSDYINATLAGTTGNTTYPDKVDTNMSKFLQYKIGYHNNSTGKNYGMCISVLNKCQNYTYDKDRNYLPDNPVIAQYLYRTMVNIKAAQDTILSDYAENCISDVVSCLSSNNYETAATKNIAVNACKSIISTCMSVNGNVTAAPSPNQIAAWAQGVYDGTISPTGN